MSNNYSDYFIKNGKFVGEFELMYQQCDDPWYQSKNVEKSYNKMTTIT